MDGGKCLLKNVSNPYLYNPSQFRATAPQIRGKGFASWLLFLRVGLTRSRAFSTEAQTLWKWLHIESNSLSIPLRTVDTDWAAALQRFRQKFLFAPPLWTIAQTEEGGGNAVSTTGAAKCCVSSLPHSLAEQAAIGLHSCSSGQWEGLLILCIVELAVLITPLSPWQ